MKPRFVIRSTSSKPDRSSSTKPKSPTKRTQPQMQPQLIHPPQPQMQPQLIHPPQPQPHFYQQNYMSPQIQQNTIQQQHFLTRPHYIQQPRPMQPPPAPRPMQQQQQPRPMQQQPHTIQTHPIQQPPQTHNLQPPRPMQQRPMQQQTYVHHEEYSHQPPPTIKQPQQSPGNFEGAYPQYSSTTFMSHKRVEPQQNQPPPIQDMPQPPPQPHPQPPPQRPSPSFSHPPTKNSPQISAPPISLPPTLISKKSDQPQLPELEIIETNKKDFLGALLHNSFLTRTELTRRLQRFLSSKNAKIVVGDGVLDVISEATYMRILECVTSVGEAAECRADQERCEFETDFVSTDYPEEIRNALSLEQKKRKGERDSSRQNEKEDKNDDPTRFLTLIDANPIKPKIHSHHRAQPKQKVDPIQRGRIKRYTELSEKKRRGEVLSKEEMKFIDDNAKRVEEDIRNMQEAEMERNRKLIKLTLKDYYFSRHTIGRGAMNRTELSDYRGQSM
ncbi:hypothetical protein QTN25_003402 [Entamoeba marina]